MARVYLSKEAKDAAFIRSILKQISNKAELGRRIGVTRQQIQYRFDIVYPRTFVELLNVLDAAGYEIKKKEEDHEEENF